MATAPHPIRFGEPVLLFVILARQAPPPGEKPASAPDPAVVSEWTDPRYASLVAAWDALQLPPEATGFLVPEP